MIAIRTRYSTTINYCLITGDTAFSYADFITAPSEFPRSLYNLIRTAPQNLEQIFNPNYYYFFRCLEAVESCLCFNILFHKDFGEVPLPIIQGATTVFIINEVPNVDTIVSKLGDIPNVYFTFINEGGNGRLRSFERYFDGVLELVELLKRDIDNLWPLGSRSNYQNILEDNALPELTKIPTFSGAHTNFFIQSQISGNYLFHKEQVHDYSSEELQNKSLEIIERTAKNIDKDSRLLLLLDQIKKIDEAFLDHGIKISVTDLDAALPPLMLASPFQNPQARKLAKIYGVDTPQIIHKLLSIEQNKNFLFTANTDSNEYADDIPIAITQFVYPRLLFIDFILYLHATFTFSPVIRFPFLGKSLSRELSFLKPNTKNRLAGPKLNRTISTFGKRFSELVLTKELEDYISTRDSQIVAISDLPIEWLQINGLPLSFTHDVCRLPETNLKGGVSFYTRNCNIAYTIPENISEKTLVIFGCPEDEYQYNVVTQMAIRECERMNIRYCRCLSVNDFIKAVKENKPEFLIIDCHGNYNDKDLSSYLDINGEMLTHTDIMNNDFHVPIVFISACTISPTYGYVHSIANAFLSTGTFCLTSTFLPIDIMNGTNTYLRILWHLDKTAKSGEYENWLGYISNATRSSVFNLIVKRLIEQVPDPLLYEKPGMKVVMKEIDRIKDLLATFPKRRQTLEQMNELLNGIDKSLKFNFTNIIYENLLYTHIGRADLVKFESWVKRRETISTALVKDN